jgi:hypothetical protein
VNANQSGNPATRLAEDEVIDQMQYVPFAYLLREFLTLHVLSLSFIRTIMTAGHETTANTLSWVLFELTRHPEVQDKLRAEIREKIAEKGNNVFSEQDYENMPYLTAVVKVSRMFRL